jgi:hypothetical protein
MIKNQQGQAKTVNWINWWHVVYFQFGLQYL